jgi:hypothetical protein
MAQSLFSYNNYTLVLSSPPPLSSRIIALSAVISGVTKVDVDYNFLYTFNVKPFKVLLNWPGRNTIYLNDMYITDINLDPLSTYSPMNSALSHTVVTSKAVDQTSQPASIQIYYENGVVHTYSITFFVNSENVIDLDLDVLGIQNTYEPYGTVFNLQSNSKNIVFTSTDLPVNERYKYIPEVDGYVDQV